MNSDTFRQVRFGLYLAFLLNGVIQWLIPFQYKCNSTGGECFACGLRTAVSLLLQGRISDAYQSNHLIVVVATAAVVIAVDLIVQLKKHRQKYCRKE